MASHNWQLFACLCTCQLHTRSSQAEASSVLFTATTPTSSIKPGTSQRVNICLNEGTECLLFISQQEVTYGFPGGSDGKESACNAGDAGLIPGSGRSPGGGHGYPLQSSRLENPMDRGAWWATVYEVTRVGYNLVTKPPPPGPYT